MMSLNFCYFIKEINEIDKYFLKLNKQDGVIVVISTNLHIKFHRKYGYKNFSKTDFDNFIKNDIK